MELFPFRNRERVLLVAIHVEPDLQLAAQDLSVARAAGADGAILVNNNSNVRSNTLRAAYDAARRTHPSWFLGLNFLDLDPLEALRVTPASANGFWFDDSKIDESKSDTEAVSYLRALREEQLARLGNLWFMPSVAMKYQREVADVARVAQLAAPYGDAIITSGPTTGSPAHPQKAQTMVGAIRPVPLGLASGVTPANVGAYIAAGARVFIVNTGISDKNGRVQPGPTKLLADHIHA